MGVGSGVEDVTEGGTAFVARPAVFAAFEFADPAGVDVVGGEVTVWVELVECGVDSVGEFAAGSALSGPPWRW
ncbi:hypothetical protein GCM10010532_098200 [Dactylosporangium siamense]|uniref:Uncharacterized protein n=1 Tax=Dactylosporangium siamense TaxID=685454 RepID=A0A919PZD8_9ACTN|nr:hypothetical protein Dsi01nite_109150 [Dactylosporangium siamense]